MDNDLLASLLGANGDGEPDPKLGLLMSLLGGKKPDLITLLPLLLPIIMNNKKPPEPPTGNLENYTEIN